MYRECRRTADTASTSSFPYQFIPLPPCTASAAPPGAPSHSHPPTLTPSHSHPHPHSSYRGHPIRSMWKQLGKLKDKAKRVLDDLSSTLDQQLQPQRARVPIPVRVPQKKPLRNYRPYSTAAHPAPIYRFGVVNLPKPNPPKYVLILQCDLFKSNIFNKSLSQKFTSFYRHKLVDSAFKFLALNAMTRFTPMTDPARFYNSITNKYDNVGCNVVLSKPVDLPVVDVSLSLVILAFEDKIGELYHSLKTLKSLEKLGDIPVVLTDKINVKFDALTKNELKNLLIEQNIDLVDIQETKQLVKWMEKELSEMVQRPRVVSGLGEYVVDEDDLSGAM